MDESEQIVKIKTCFDKRTVAVNPNVTSSRTKDDVKRWSREVKIRGGIKNTIDPTQHPSTSTEVIFQKVGSKLDFEEESACSEEKDGTFKLL